MSILSSTCWRLWILFPATDQFVTQFLDTGLYTDFIIFWLLSRTWGWTFTRVWDYTHVSMVICNKEEGKIFTFWGDHNVCSGIQKYNSLELHELRISCHFAWILPNGNSLQIVITFSTITKLLDMSTFGINEKCSKMSTSKPIFGPVVLETFS